MKRTKKILLFITFGILATATLSCEDPYDIDINTGESQLVVDAFVKNTNDGSPKKITLTKTVDFFEAGKAPAATGADVAILNLNTGAFYEFIENGNQPGEYLWTDTSAIVNGKFGQIGDTLNLFVAYELDTFVSFSVVNRTTPIDSVIFFFDEGNSFTDEGFYAEVKASDLPGIGDIYWFRTWVNGIYLSKAAEINVAYDASFTPGATTDGIPFILPIRRGINPINDDENEIRKDTGQYIPEVPFKTGDSIYVEIWSINEETLFFLQQIQTEVNNGGLFATPPTNVRTNVFNINPNKKTEAVGHFCISEVSSGGKKLTD